MISQITGSVFISTWIVAFGSVVAARADGIVWIERSTNDDKLKRSDLDGGNVAPVLSWPFIASPSSVAVDPVAGKVYWTQVSPTADQIRRCNLNGTTVETIVSWPAVAEPVAIVVDTNGGKIYWAEGGLGDERIRRANLDGTGAATILSWPFVADVVGLALDLNAGKIYWIEDSFGKERIARCDLNGGNVTTIVAFPLIASPSALSLDTIGGLLYWSERALADDAIRRADLNGANIQSIAEWPLVSDPVAVQIDPFAAKVYWAEQAIGEDAIRRSELDGTGTQTLVGFPLVADPKAMSLNLTAPPPCMGSADCDDEQLCTIDICNYGVCRHTPRECSSPNPCMVAACNPTNGLCESSPLVCPSGQVCVGGQCATGCTQNTDCNDGVDCTVDRCENVLGQDICLNPPDDGLCDTGLFCSALRCDPAFGCVVAHECISTTGNPCPDADSCDEASDTCAGCLAPFVVATGSRHIGITPSDQGATPIAIMVRGDCINPAVECIAGYVQPVCVHSRGDRNGQPCETDEDCLTCDGGTRMGESCATAADCPPAGTGFLCVGECSSGRIGSQPVYRIAAAWGTLQLTGARVRPATLYEVHAECDFGAAPILSAAGRATTWRWGDGNGDGFVNVFDVSGSIDILKSVLTSMTFEGANIGNCDVDGVVNIVDVANFVDAVKGIAFPCPDVCP